MIIEYQPPLLAVMKDRAVRARLKTPTVAAFILTTHIRLGARLPEIGDFIFRTDRFVAKHACE